MDIKGLMDVFPILFLAICILYIIFKYRNKGIIQIIVKMWKEREDLIVSFLDKLLPTISNYEVYNIAVVAIEILADPTNQSFEDIKDELRQYVINECKIKNVDVKIETIDRSIEAAFVVFRSMPVLKKIANEIINDGHEKIDTKNLTVFAINILAKLWVRKNELDDVAFKSTILAINRCLSILRKDGISKDSVEHIGKFLYRLYHILCIYNEKTENQFLTRVEFTLKLTELLNELDRKGIK